MNFIRTTYEYYITLSGLKFLRYKLRIKVTLCSREYPTLAPQGKQQRRCGPASTTAAKAAPLPYRADWLSKRKVEKPPQRITAGHRESAIPRKM